MKFIRSNSHPATTQDLWVQEKCPYENGYYVELGAFDGFHHSNTLNLEEYWRWNGLLVEANTAHIETLQERAGRNTLACGKAVVPMRLTRAGQRQFAQYAYGGQFSGVVEMMPEEWRKEHRRRGNPVNEVPLTDLPALLLAGNAPERIDYLSIDTEGSEYAILEDFFTWEQNPYKVFTLTVEFRFDSELMRKLRTLLEPRGFVLDCIRGFDLCFLNTKMVEHRRLWPTQIKTGLI